MIVNPLDMQLRRSSRGGLSRSKANCVVNMTRDKPILAVSLPLTEHAFSLHAKHRVADHSRQRDQSADEIKEPVPAKVGDRKSDNIALEAGAE